MSDRMATTPADVDALLRFADRHEARRNAELKALGLDEAGSFPDGVAYHCRAAAREILAHRAALAPDPAAQARAAALEEAAVCVEQQALILVRAAVRTGGNAPAMACATAEYLAGLACRIRALPAPPAAERDGGGHE